MKRRRTERAPAENAYADRVSHNKRLAGYRRRTQRETEMRREAKRKNDAPIF